MVTADHSKPQRDRKMVTVSSSNAKNHAISDVGASQGHGMGMGNYALRPDSTSSVSQSPAIVGLPSDQLACASGETLKFVDGES